jgi:hypothetical protein
MEINDYLTHRQVMERYNKSYVQVRYAAETGRLKAYKVGWQWVFPVDKLPDSWPEAPRNLRRKGVKKA